MHAIGNVQLAGGSKTVLSDQTRKLHEDCMLDWSGTLRPRGQCCPRGRSMPPPLDRLRLPSGSDPTFPPPVHESVSGTLLTTTGQDLSPRSDRNPSQQQEYRSHEQSQRHACNAPTSSTVQDSASHLSTAKDSQGLEASHSSSSSPAALPEVAAKSRDLLPNRGKHHDRHVRSDFQTMLLWRDVSTSVTRSWLPAAVFDDAEHGLRTSTGKAWSIT